MVKTSAFLLFKNYSEVSSIGHPREYGDPENWNWIPVFTGMTE
jgi:hypothetical protein